MSRKTLLPFTLLRNKEPCRRCHTKFKAFNSIFHSLCRTSDKITRARKNMKLSRYLIQLNFRLEVTWHYSIFSFQLSFSYVLTFWQIHLKQFHKWANMEKLIWTQRIIHSFCCWCDNSSWLLNMRKWIGETPSSSNLNFRNLYLILLNRKKLKREWIYIFSYLT